MTTVTLSHRGDSPTKAELENKVSDLEATAAYRGQMLRQALDLIERAIRERVLSNGLTNDMARFRARAPR